MQSLLYKVFYIELFCILSFLILSFVELVFGFICNGSSPEILPTCTHSD